MFIIIVIVYRYCSTIQLSIFPILPQFKHMQTLIFLHLSYNYCNYKKKNAKNRLESLNNLKQSDSG